MRINRRLSYDIRLWLALAVPLWAPHLNSGHAEDVRIGSGQAYAILGDLPVKHRGRVKPLSSLAIEEVKLIHGRARIELTGPDGVSTSRWEPVAAILDWSARPEFWDDQDFIMVDSLPLRQLLLGATIRSRVRSLADTEATALRSSFHALAEQPELTEADLRAAAHRAGEASTAGSVLNSLADRIGAGHKWLSPRVLESTRFQHEGRTLTFPQWVCQIQDRADRARLGGRGAAPRLTPIEEHAAEVGERFFYYRAIREHDSPATRPLDLQLVPRPSHEPYFDYSTEAFEKGMDPTQALSPLEADVAITLAEYLRGLPGEDWALPGEDGQFDQKFAAWLLSNSPWIPLGVILRSGDSELSLAGLPLEQVVALRVRYRDLENAERAAPGRVPEAIALALVVAVRNLGTSFANYPGASEMARESYLNRSSPFSKAAMAHGFSLAFLLSSLGVPARERARFANPATVLYGLGLAGLMVGIGLELDGCLLRFRVFGRVTVTNMYETVIWFATATSTLGLAIEIFRRDKYAALAASGTALVATVLAESVSLLDPNARTVLPLTRVNRWLAGHVLATVSGYAALALALGLGLLAVGHYLTASNRRAPFYRELAWPSLLGIPLHLLGRLGIGPSTRLLPRTISDIQLPGHVGAGLLESIGGALTLVVGFSLLGELANRAPRRACILGAAMAAVGSTGLVAGAMGAVQGPLERALTSREAWLVGLAGGASAVLGLLGGRARDARARIEALSDLIAWTMMIGVVLLASGSIVGGLWALSAWGGTCPWDPKVACALIAILAYLVPLYGRFAGWINTPGFVATPVAGFVTVLLSWYGLNFVIRVGRHDYGFTGGGDAGIVLACTLAMLAAVGAAGWRRFHSR